MKKDNSSSQIKQLEQAIAVQESLRGTLDDAIVDATIAALKKQLSELSPAAPVEQQRKLATMLFMDVVGSTRLTGDLDPEVNMAIMDAALQRLAVPVEAHGGHVTRYMGDGYLAIFGLPRARENEPEMAVRAGLEIIRTTRLIAQDLKKEHGLKGFQVRVGVNTGPVVAGGVTEAEGTVMGAAVNLAARLESAAPPGGVLISQHTYQHVRGLFEMEPMELLQANGFLEPVQTYLVKKTGPRAFRPKTRGVEGVKTSMIGREEELNALKQALNSVAQDGESRMVTIVGEAGLGKSRLLHEFEGWFEGQSLTLAIFKGRATLETLEMPYALLRDMLAFRFEILDDDPVLIVRKKFEAGFKKPLPDTENQGLKAHFVGQLLGYDFSDSHHLRGVMDAPQQIHDRAVVYLTNYFKALAAETPVLIFLDDIHWADGSSLDILLQISEDLINHGVLFVALTRPTLFERRPSWGEGKRYKILQLHPLSQSESQHLVDEVLKKVKDLPQKLGELIISNAEGNPFYLEELIKMLIEDGVIVKREPDWLVEPDRLVHERIPPTLTGVIQARLDGLPISERTILQQASVVGRVFWDQVVEHIEQEIQSQDRSDQKDARETSGSLDTLREREMIFENEVSTFSEAIEYFFKHAILRDVTYESVLKRNRRRYHALVADWLIAHSGERAGEVNGLIAGHLEKAARKTEAFDYLLRAAEDAVSNYAINEAADFYDRAAALVLEDDLERRYTLLLGQDTVFRILGDRAAHREVLENLALVVEALADDRKRSEFFIRKAWLAFWTSDFEEILAAATKALAFAEAVGAQDLIGQAYYAMAWAYTNQGKQGEADHYASEALRTARPAGSRRAEGNALNLLGLLRIAQGDYYAALDYLEKFLAIALEIGDLDRETTAHNNLGVAYTPLGNYQAALDNFQAHLRISLEMGDRVSESTALVNLGWVYATQGEWDLAKSHLEPAIAMKREFEHSEAEAEGLLWLGHAWVGLGQPEKAFPLYHQSLAIRRELDQSPLAMGVVAGLARAALALGDLPTALGHVEEINTYLAEGGTLHGTWEPLRIYLTCSHVFQAGDDPRADKILEDAYTLLQERASKIPNEADRTLFLEKVPWHREIVAEWETGHERD